MFNRNDKYKDSGKRFILAGTVLVGVYSVMHVVAKIHLEPEVLDTENPYIQFVETDSQPKNFYESMVKPVLDGILSFGGLVILSPLYGVISLAVWLDDPGPVFFTQKRVGKDKHFFWLHKYRSMKMSTPHDVPTHMLENPDQYITRVGRILRKSSLDELPQIWDIFRGKMSVIGPRPALWNQKDLVEERQKYGANSLKPGLTGLAQIRGRDELEIPEKAKTDGEYTEVLHKGGFTAFGQDVDCFIGTVKSVLKHDGVVEGGTGVIHALKESKKPYTACGRRIEPINPADVGFEDYGFKKRFHIDKKVRKKVLITGAGSYIGESFVKWAKKKYPNIETIAIDMKDEKWRKTSFSEFDAVFHVAGIAHSDVGKVRETEKEKYYRINTDLAIETAQKARNERVKQFIFMSSIIVYGDSAPYGKKKVIDEYTLPAPVNFYGDSKWQADKEVRKLANENFRVAVLRPPMIYGYGSKGNYPVLAKLAKYLPVFPDIENSRSMLYIDNLCEFLCLLVLSGEGGVYFPQNSTDTKTSELVKIIGEAAHKPVYTLKVLNPVVAIVKKMPGKLGGMIDKAFGNLSYDQRISTYDGIEYQNISFAESIRQTEGTYKVKSMKDTTKQQKSVLMVASVASMIDQFNIPNIKLLIRMGYDVDVATNFVEGSTCTDEKIQELLKLLDELQVDCYQIDFTRKAVDIKTNIKAFRQLDDVVRGKSVPVNKIRYHQINKQKGYTFVHTHSPIGGAIGRIVAKKYHLKTMYTAHGFHFYKGAPIRNWFFFYPIERELSWITDVLITINHEDYKRAKKEFHAKSTVYIPGVGVDTKKNINNLMDPEEKRKELGILPDEILLLSVGELIPRKNHEVVIRALAKIQNSKLHYIIAGKGELEMKLKELVRVLGVTGQVHFLGFRTDVSDLYQVADLFLLPSHQEGLSMALMEAIICGTPVACSNIRGNTDLIRNKKYLFNENSVDDVVRVLSPLIISREQTASYSKRSVEVNMRRLKDYRLDSVEKLMEMEYQRMEKKTFNNNEHRTKPGF